MRITRRKALLGAGIVGSSALAGAGTTAYLEDSEPTTFSFVTGSLTLAVDPSTLQFEQDDGDRMHASVTITNEGSLDAAQLLWTGLTFSGPDAGPVSRAMRVHAIEYDGTDVTDAVASEMADDDPNGNGIFDLADVGRFLGETDLPMERLVDGTGLPAGDSRTFGVTVEVDYSQSEISEDNMKMSAEVAFTAKQAGPEGEDESSDSDDDRAAQDGDDPEESDE